MRSTTYENVASWIVKIALFVVPFIPLLIAPSLFFPYITGKAFIFRTVVEVAFFAWVFLAIFYPKYRPQKSPLLWAIGIFMAVVALATIFSVSPVKSFWSNFERMEGMAMYVHLFAYFIVLASVFNRKDWFIFFNLFVVSGILESAYAIMQRLGYFANLQGGPRVEGTIGNPAYLAAYLLFIFGFCALLWLRAENRIAKWYYAAAGFFALLTLYFTASRGPSLGLLMGAVLVVVLYLIFARKGLAGSPKAKKIALGVLAFLIAAPLGLWLIRGTDFVKSSGVLTRLTSLSFTDTTIKSRFTIWSMSFEGFREHPLLGWGPENYPIVFSKYYKPSMWPQEPWFDRSHNVVFDWLINAGLLGLLAYIGIFVAAFYSLWRHYAQKALALDLALLFTGLFAAYGFQNLFVFDNLATYVSFFAMLAYIERFDVESEAIENKKEQTSFGRGLSGVYAPIVAALLSVALGFVFYSVVLRSYFINSSLLTALRVQNSDPVAAFAHYNQALSYGSAASQEAQEQLARFAVGVLGAQNVKDDFKLAVLQKAMDEGQKRINDYPMDPRSYLFLAVVLEQTNLTEQTMMVLNKALELSPKKQQIYFEIADMYLRQSNFPKAIEYLKNAFELDRAYNGARINLVAAYIMSGAQDEADKLLIERYGSVNVNEPLLAAVYNNKKNYKRLAGIWQAFVNGNPQNVQYRFDLARAHQMAGQAREAIKVLQEAAKVDPGAQAQIDEYIKKVQSGVNF